LSAIQKNSVGENTQITSEVICSLELDNLKDSEEKRTSRGTNGKDASFCADIALENKWTDVEVTKGESVCHSLNGFYPKEV
jgi:hypothetical protein